MQTCRRRLPKRRSETSVGGRERRSAVENSRETLKYCPTQSDPYPQVIRLASSMTKDRVTSECADNLHTRPLQLRLRRRRESHRSLTMPSGRRIKPGLWHVTQNLQPQEPCDENIQISTKQARNCISFLIIQRSFRNNKHLKIENNH